MVDVEGILQPYYDATIAPAGELALFDAHTHIGANDPDGFKQTPEQLIEVLKRADARGVVFPMHEPDGYPGPNDVAMDAAARSGGRLVPFCRVNPHDGALAEATRCLDAGARGIKLHPRAEQFGMDAPAVRDLVALAHEREVPILIHAGRGIPALGQNTVRLSGEFPRAKLILAHAAISDLAWMWRVMPDHPNLYVDTAWWNPADLIALFTLAPPSQVLWASDSPYGLPVMSATLAMRCALQAGVGPEALRLIAGRQLERVLDGAEPAEAEPAAGESRALDPLLERVVTHLISAMGRAFARTDPDEAVALARLACAVGDEHPNARVFAAVLDLLDEYAKYRDVPNSPGRPLPPAGRLLVTALVVARTPDVALPDSHVPATREEAEKASGA
jgi:predicted TIM-barrel fold metal-dependent hydrolase